LKSDWLHFLQPEQLSQVHEAVLQVLNEVGVRIEWEPALEIYHRAGCPINFDKRLVFITENILTGALETAPSNFRLHAIDPDFDIEVTLDNIYTIAGSSALSVLDLDGQHRPANLQDLNDFTRLIDGLEQAHIMHAMVIPQDIPQVGFDRRLFATILKNTRKHYYSQGQGGSSVQDQVEMAALIQGSLEAVMQSPIFSFVVCFNSPLVHSAERLQEMMECARYRIPIWLEPTNMMGATAPLTVAGALVEHTANSLAGLATVTPAWSPCVSDCLRWFQYAVGDVCGSLTGSCAAPLRNRADGPLLRAALSGWIRLRQLPALRSSGL
jgi:trimethylamine--corrinoid protein Co-methyltransferase